MALRIVCRLKGLLPLRDAVLLGWFFLYLLLVVQPHLFYQVRCPLFSCDPEFVAGFLGRAGGVVDYLSLFLAQFFAVDWLGALLLVIEAWLIGALAGACFQAIAGKPSPGARLLATVLFVFGCTRYDLGLTLGPPTVAVLACVLLYLRLPIRARAGRFLAYLLLSGAAYYGIAGALGKLHVVLALLVFSSLCIAGELRREGRRRAIGAAAYAAGTVLLAAAGERFFLKTEPGDWRDALSLTLTPVTVLVVLLYLFFPLAAFSILGGVGGWTARLFRRLRLAHRGDSGSGAEGKAPDAAGARVERLVWGLQTVAMVWVVSAVATYGLTNEASRRALQMDYAVMNGRWGEVLQTVRFVPANEWNMMTDCDINAALFHTGQLPEAMFAYPQRTRRLMLPFEEPPAFPFLYRLTETNLELGRIGNAEHTAYEAFSMVGRNPYVVRQLALIHLTKGQLPAARLYLNMLKEDWVHGPWARRYLALTRSEAALGADPVIRQLRAVMLTRDDVREVMIFPESEEDARLILPDRMLVNLLARNKTNRMAFEYLMAMNLLSGQLGQVAQNINRLDDFGEKQIPPLYEEALAMLSVETGRTPDLHGRAISAETLSRYRQFRQDLAQARVGGEDALSALVRAYGGTYWLYRALAETKP